MARRLARFRRAVILVVVLVASSTARAEDIAVPVGIQAELLLKVATYDRNLKARAGDRVRILIVTKHGDPDSQRTSMQMQSALSNASSVGGLPHSEILVEYESAPAIAARCRADRVAIVFFSVGFDSQLEAIRTALDGVDVLSASAVAEYVPKGIVLGFDLVSGRPKLLGNVTQARRQHVDLPADLLRIMRIYD